MFRAFILLVLLAVLLAGCSDSSRDKAATQALEQARSQEQMLPAERVIELYQSVVNEYPDTEQAKQAQAGINQIKKRQQQVLDKRNAGDVLDRVSTVLTGYKAFSGKLPGSIKDLDAGDYMFDSSYMAEIIPEGASLYLSIDADNNASRMWLQQDGQDKVLSRSLADEKLVDMSVADLQELKTKWQELAKVGRLVQVKL